MPDGISKASLLDYAVIHAFDLSTSSAVHTERAEPSSGVGDQVKTTCPAALPAAQIFEFGYLRQADADDPVIETGLCSAFQTLLPRSGGARNT
jgi:hypothetical protein